MRLVERTDQKTVAVRWSWLPTWIGMNVELMQELDAHLGERFVGMKMDERTLDAMHAEVLSFLTRKFDAEGMTGLFDYLDGIKYVRDA